MKPIKQTPLGWIACWLGFHTVIVADTYADTWANRAGSARGGCVRCNKAFQWDF